VTDALPQKCQRVVMEAIATARILIGPMNRESSS